MFRMLRILASATLALALGGMSVQARERVVFAQGTSGLINYPLYVARAMKFFEARDVDAEFSVLRGGAAAIAAVMSGDAQIYVGSPALAIKARNKKQDMTIFAAVLDQIGSNIVVQGDIADRLAISDGTPIQERIKALKGLRIGISGSGSTTDLILRSIVESAGLTPDRDLVLAPIGATAILPAFVNRRIDGFILSPPAGETAMLKHGGRSLINIMKGDYEPLRGFLFLTFVASDEWLRANASVAARVVRALWDAQFLIAKEPAKAQAAAATFYPKTDAQVFAEASESVRKAIPDNPRISAEGIAKNLEFIRLVEKEDVSVSAEEVFTNAFVERAMISK